MSAMPDPAELAPSRDPAAYGRRPLFTVGLVAWIALCVLCLLAGAAIGRFGVQITPAGKTDSLPPDVPQRVTQPAAQSPSPPLQAMGPETSPAAVSQLSERVSRLESSSARTDQAAAAALAAAELSEAAQSAAPFGQDLAAYQKLAPASPDLAALAPLAALGAPTRQALAASLPDFASLAAAAARQPGKDASLLSRLAALIGRVIIVRRVDLHGAGVDGVLARAEAATSSGDLESALAGLKTLPAPARAPLGGWIAAADRRVQIDQHIGALRTAALANLTEADSAPP
jgi:hypothetical protein